MKDINNNTAESNETIAPKKKGKKNLQMNQTVLSRKKKKVCLILSINIFFSINL
jgi:hypothetical protein